MRSGKLWDLFIYLALTSGELKNGIQSEAHGPAEFGVIFAPLQTNSHPVSEVQSAIIYKKVTL